MTPQPTQYLARIYERKHAELAWLKNFLLHPSLHRRTVTMR